MSDVSNQRSRAGARRFAGANWGKIAKRTGIGVVLLAAGGVMALAGERLFGGRVGANEVRITTFQDWRVINAQALVTGRIGRDARGILEARRRPRAIDARRERHDASQRGE